MHIRGNLGDDIADGETGFTPAAVSASSDRHRVQAKEEFLYPSTPPPHTHTSSKPAASHEEEFPSGQGSM